MNDTVTVLVEKVDRDRKKISLTMVKGKQGTPKEMAFRTEDAS